MKNIAFFGASITQQKSGYVSRFKELNPNLEINQFGYGGMYITDAGVCFIDEVVSTKPEYCFLDWFSPACYRPPEKIKDYLDTIVGKLFNINCSPIFLFFYRKQMDPGWFIMFDYLKQYSYKYNINYIDLSKIENPDECLRDNIHTNDFGAEKYGKIVNEKFHSMEFKNHSVLPPQNRYDSILSISSNVEATEYIELESIGCSSIIGVLQNIGPYTDDVKYYIKDKDEEHILLLKDKWSERYERQTIKIQMDFCQNIMISIPNNKKLVWEKLFYIGDPIRVVNYQ